LENYWLLQERQPEIGGALSSQRMLAFFFSLKPHFCGFLSSDDLIVLLETRVQD